MKNHCRTNVIHFNINLYNVVEEELIDKNWQKRRAAYPLKCEEQRQVDKCIDTAFHAHVNYIVEFVARINIGNNTIWN